MKLKINLKFWECSFTPGIWLTLWHTLHKKLHYIFLNKRINRSQVIKYGIMVKYNKGLKKALVPSCNLQRFKIFAKGTMFFFVKFSTFSDGFNFVKKTKQWTYEENMLWEKRSKKGERRSGIRKHGILIFNNEGNFDQSSQRGQYDHVHAGKHTSRLIWQRHLSLVLRYLSSSGQICIFDIYSRGHCLL